MCVVVLLHPGVQQPIEASQNPNPANSNSIRELRNNVGLTELKKLAFSLEQSTKAPLENIKGADHSLNTNSKTAEEAVDDSGKEKQIPRLDTIFNRFIMTQVLPKITRNVTNE